MSRASRTANTPATPPQTDQIGDSHDVSEESIVATTSEAKMTAALAHHHATRRGERPVERTATVRHDHHVVATNIGTAHMQRHYRSGTSHFLGEVDPSIRTEVTR